MPDLFTDPPSPRPDAPLTLPNFAMGARVVESHIDPKLGRQVEILARSAQKGGRLVYHDLLAELSAERHLALFQTLAHEKLLGEADAANRAKESDARG